MSIFEVAEKGYTEPDLGKFNQTQPTDKLPLTIQGKKINMGSKSENLKLFLLVTAFIEGGTVMAAEIIGAKLIAPYFGSSLYVWSAVLAITLGGLTAGYFSGGILSEKYPERTFLFSVILSAALFVGIMPFLSSWIMESTLDMGLKPGIIISAIVFLLPPLMFLGMVSPLMIRQISFLTKNAGSAAGLVYGVSTSGGILMTFVTGFYLIPDIGLTSSSLICGGLAGTMAILGFLLFRKDQ